MKDYKFKINGKDYDVTVNGIRDGKASVIVNGKEYSVDCSSSAPITSPAAPVKPVTRQQTGAVPTAAAAAHAPAKTVAAGGKVIEAPLPGVIISLFVTVGQSVKRGQKIAVLEAMKMENDILSPIDGTVKDVFVQRGDSVLEGSKIATIA